MLSHESLGMGADERNDLIGLRPSQQDFSVRGHDKLAVPIVGDAPEQIEDLALQNEVEMRVRLIEEQYRRRPRIEERQQQEDLVEAAENPKRA